MPEPLPDLADLAARLSQLEASDRRQTIRLNQQRTAMAVGAGLVLAGFLVSGYNFASPESQERAERLAIGLVSAGAIAIVGKNFVDPREGH